jgi:hypothetical protein
LKQDEIKNRCHVFSLVFKTENQISIVLPDVSTSCSCWHTTVECATHRQLFRFVNEYSEEKTSKQSFVGLFSSYFVGAIKKWIELQNNGDNLIVMLADLHAVTLPREPDVLRCVLDR